LLIFENEKTKTVNVEMMVGSKAERDSNTTEAWKPQ